MYEMNKLHFLDSENFQGMGSAFSTKLSLDFYPLSHIGRPKSVVIRWDEPHTILRFQEPCFIVVLVTTVFVVSKLGRDKSKLRHNFSLRMGGNETKYVALRTRFQNRRIKR